MDEIAALIDRLRNHADYMTRSNAAQELKLVCSHKRGDLRVLDALLEAIAYDPDAFVRSFAISALMTAFWSLGTRPDARTRDILLRCLNDEFLVRNAAAKALARLGEQRAIGQLMNIVQGGMNRGAYVGLSDAIEALGDFESAGATALFIKVLKEAEFSDCRLAAAKALRRLPRAEAVEALIGALEDEESNVQIVAAYALGEIADSRAAEPLGRMYRRAHRDSDKERVALHALEALMARGVITALEKKRWIT
jgi:HEAT repeat protein